VHILNAKEKETMNQVQFKKIIANAIKAEVEANKFYSSVSKKAKDAGMKRLFQELAEEEAQHKLTLKGYLAKGAEKIQFSESADYKVADELPTPP
jgi:rubrerythrin